MAPDKLVAGNCILLFAILLGLALSESNQTIVMSKNKELLQEWQ